MDAVLWTRTNSISNQVAALSEEEKRETRKAGEEALIGEERETMNEVAETVLLRYI